MQNPSAAFPPVIGGINGGSKTGSSPNSTSITSDNLQEAETDPAKLKEMHNDFKDFLRSLEKEAVGPKMDANDGGVKHESASTTTDGSSFQSKITNTLNKLKDSDGLVNVSI